jgi:hypothetical protein
MKCTMAICILATLCGCATGHWVSDGADPRTLATATDVCQADALAAVPEPSVYGEPCNADGTYMNCSVRSAEVRTMPRTEADLAAQAQRARARLATYRQCMQKLGWRLTTP